MGHFRGTFTAMVVFVTGTWLCLMTLVEQQVGASFAPKVIKLDATPEQYGLWNFVSADGKNKTAASVPGGIYSSLLRERKLPEDLFWRFNDQEYRWVSKTGWTLSREFTVDDEVYRCHNVVLVLHGVDTVADVYFNDELLGKCDNMFIRYRFDVTGKLKYRQKNTIKLFFTSPISAANERFRRQAASYVVPPQCTPPEYHGECHVNHLRKMQASFAWDWGPAFPSVGAWKGVEIEAYNSTLVRDAIVTTKEDGSSWIVNSTLFFETGTSSQSGERELFMKIERKDGVSHEMRANVVIESDSKGEGKTVAALRVPKDFVELWWPNGEGEQELYNLTIALADKQSKEVSVFETKIGFRTIELVQTPVDKNDKSKGLTFYFKVNSRPIFAKGSNWIPADVLPERGINKTVVAPLLHAAKEANMNMLRVWGGGVYESDYFYEMADELGLLIWQDMMFACSMYPTDAAFLRSVTTEVEQQVRRLQPHASVVAFAGNNENEAALRFNWYGTKDNYQKYAEDYVKLYVDTIGSVMRSLVPSSVFIVSSPTNGVKSEEEGHIATNPYDPKYGDTHTYNYLVNGWNPVVFPVVRFSSEYGFQSLPSLLSYKKVALPEDLTLKSNFSTQRQHHPMGYEEIILELMMHMHVPGDFGSIESFPTIIYYSQINQAMSIKTETEALRRSRDLLTSDGRGLTMGALYWQLNDVWQAPTWSSIEYDGRWKMLHYFAKNMFSPVLVSPVLVAGDELKIVIVSDLPEELKNATLIIRVCHWGSFQGSYAIIKMPIDVKAAGTTLANVMSLNATLKAASCGEVGTMRNNCVVYFQLLNSNRVSISDNFFLPTEPKHANMKNTTLEVFSIKGPHFRRSSRMRQEFSIEISSEYPALFVWLETPIEGHFSDNGFLMVFHMKSVKFFTNSIVTKEELKSSLTLRSLNSV